MPPTGPAAKISGKAVVPAAPPRVLAASLDPETTIKTAPALLAACLLTTACLENEESLEVRPDGSVRVEVTSSGDVDDLTTGYALPLHAPWQALDLPTRTWASVFGPATGGPAVRARFEADAWAEMGDPEDPQATLRASAEFASVDELPSFWAPATEPYRTALLRRDTSLEIEAKGARTVYTLTRTYPARQWFDTFDEDLLPGDVNQRLKAEQRLSDDQVARATAAIREHVHLPGNTHLYTSALGAVYTEGDASLSAAGYERVVARIAAATDAVLTEANVRAFFDAVYAIQTSGAEGERIDDALDLELRLHAAWRAALSDALESERLDDRVRNAIRERFEWNLSSLAHSKDLADEQFTLRVVMPGTIVAGNFDELSGGAATWVFEGDRLFGAGRTMRVVSVLE